MKVSPRGSLLREALGLAREALDVGGRIATALERLAAAAERNAGIARAARSPRRRPRSVPADVRVTEMDRARARRALHGAGFRLIDPEEP